MLALLGGSASVGLAGCSALFGDDDDPVEDDDDGTADPDDDGDDDDDEETEPERTNADKAQAAWERVEANPRPEQQDIRDEAYIEIEEAVRDDMVLLPLYHNLEERFWYDGVDVPKVGAMGGHRQVHNETTVSDRDELRLINATMSSLDPIQITDTASNVVATQIYETLTDFPNGETELENGLIDSFELDEEGTTFTFELVSAEFHDGTEMTADDVVFSLRRLAESEFSTRDNFIIGGGGFLGVDVEREDPDGPYSADNVVPDTLAVEAVGENTVEMTLRDPNPAALDVLAYDGFSILPEGIVGDIEGYDGDVEVEELSTGETAIGTGPFEIDFWEPGEEARVTASDDYWGNTADVDSVHWEIIEDDEALFTYAVSEQNADVFGIPTQFYDRDLIDADEDDRGRDSGTYDLTDENGETVNYLGIPELSTFYVAWNVPQAPRATRQAVAYVTDHEELIEEVFEGRGVEAFSFTPPAMWPEGPDGYNDWVDNWPYSPNETDIPAAQQVLEEAGITEDDPFEMEFTTYESVVFQEFAELTRDKLADTPLEFSIDETQFGTLLERGRDGDLQMYTLGWIWSWPGVDYGHFGFEPRNTDTSRIPAEADGYYLDWQTELTEE